MKINDIITEAYRGFSGSTGKYSGSVKGDVDQSIPNAVIEPELRNTDTYMQMRYGMALAAAAAAQDENFEQESAWAENIGMVAYSDKELDQIKHADKLMGVRSIALTNSKSQEKPDVGTTSPVASTSWRKSK
jgi:hypothetical protein